MEDFNADRITFTIDVFSPDTLPMERMTKYLAQLAKILGNTEHIHFDSVKKGSAQLVSRCDQQAIPKLSSRLRSFKEFPDALKAFDQINNLLQEDAAVGGLSFRDDKVIVFPGRNLTEITVHKLPTETCFIRGELINIGGKDATVPLRILEQGTGRTISGNTINKDIAKGLAHHLFGMVEVVGIGRWQEDKRGDWNLSEFRVNAFTALKTKSISEVFKPLRKMEPNTDAPSSDPQEILRTLRGDD